MATSVPVRIQVSVAHAAGLTSQCEFIATVLPHTSVHCSLLMLLPPLCRVSNPIPNYLTRSLSSSPPGEGEEQRTVKEQFLPLATANPFKVNVQFYTHLPCASIASALTTAIVAGHRDRHEASFYRFTSRSTHRRVTRSLARAKSTSYICQIK